MSPLGRHPMLAYDAELASLQPTMVVESIAVPDGRVDVWRRDEGWLVTWIADDPTHPRPLWTVDPAAYGGLRGESIDAVREWIRDTWPDG